MKKVIVGVSLCLFCVSRLFAQTIYQQNGLEGLKLNGKVVVSAKYRSIVPVGQLFLVWTTDKENKVIDSKEKEIIGASQAIDVLYAKSAVIYSVKPKGDSLFYLVDQNGKRISKRGYNYAEVLFYSYHSTTSDYIFGVKKDTNDIYFKRKLIFSKNGSIRITGAGTLRNLLIIKEVLEKNITAIDTSGHQTVITKGDEYTIRNSYLITSTVERTDSGYPSFLYSIYDRNLKFLFQTGDLIDPVDGADHLFVRKQHSYGIVDTTQKVIVPFQYNDYQFITINKKPFTIMRDDRGRWTMFNAQCDVLSEGVYFTIAKSDNEFAIVTRQFGASTENLLYGLIDSKANSIIQSRFQKIEFNKEKGKYVFNAQGKIYEYRAEEIKNNRVKINSLIKPLQ